MSELVQLKNDEAVCDSLMIAEKFYKEHRNVLQSIDNLIAENSAVKKMFQQTYYQADNGQKYRKFLMNRDGFSLLVMGFSGKKALEWKLKYIEAFNKMEKVIREKSTVTWLVSRQAGMLTRKSETDVIKELVEYAKAQGSTHADMLYMTYSKLANKMTGISDRDTASVVQLNRLEMIEQIILCVIREGMVSGQEYKQIYQNCKERLELVRELAYLGIEQKGA